MEQVLQGITPTFEFSEAEVKGVKEYVISGYISTSNLDLANDVVTKACMEDMATQIKSGAIMLDFEHETIHNENLDINPFGRIVDARVDSKGLWVKAVMNSANKRFHEIWGSIKGGFLRAFSIAFKPIEAVTKYVEGKAVRVLNKLKLINVGITGTPVNEDCAMDNVFVKAIKELDEEEEEKKVEEEKSEESEGIEEKALTTTSFPVAPSNESQSTSNEEDKNKMAEEETTKPVEEVVETEEAVTEEEAKEEAVEEAKVEEAVEAEADTEVKALKASITELKAQVAKLEAELAKPELKATLEAAPQKQLNENAPTPLECIK